MARGDISVDTDRLRELSRRLDLLHQEFEGIEDRVDGYADAVGHRGRLTEALEDLAGNWSKKRKEVLAQLEQCASLALDAARHYENLDRTMAAGIRDVAGGPGGP